VPEANYYLRSGKQIYMSKIGEKPVTVPAAVTVQIERRSVEVKGPLGQMNFQVPHALSIEQKDGNLLITRSKEDKKSKSLHGLYRSLISNAVIGVEKAWEKKLEIVGTGYSVKLQGEELVFKVGYSHTVTFKKVEGIKYIVDGNNKLTVTGFDKYKVGEVSHKIKMIRKPDVYKGKGIKYEGEKLRIKAGKKAKTAE
jgi:large subunit ribosomal protein L6